MRATVVVVTFDHRDVVVRCLDALRASLGPEDEVVVVDNASRDGTVEQIAATHPWVRVERSARNVGFGAACNRGARVAAGRHLVFLNPDTEPTPGWLDALLAGLRAVPDAGLATARLLLPGAPARIDAFGNDVHLSGITPSRGWGEPASRYDALEEVSAASGACLAISRELFGRLGGFDERLFLYFEDTDLSLRARLAGHRCVAVPDATVVHDHRPGFSPVKLRYLERNRWWTLLKLYRVRTLLALAPVLGLSEVVAWGMAAKCGPRHVLAKGRAWAELARWLPDLPAERARVQATRAVSDGQLLRLHATRLPFRQAGDGALVGAGERMAAAAFAGGRALVAAAGVR